MAGVYDMLPDRSQWEIEPRGNVWLLHNVPLSPAYTDTWKFPSASAQFNHFVGLGGKLSEYVKRVYHLQSFTRVSENKYRCEGSINEVYDINYMVLDNYLYKKAGHESKYFYCFVTNVEYVNNNCVEITFIVDILQTFMFDVKLNPCIIERRHSKTDNIGDNIVDEGIKIGDTDMVCAFARGINATGITTGLNAYSDNTYKLAVGIAIKDIDVNLFRENVNIVDTNAVGIDCYFLKASFSNSGNFQTLNAEWLQLFRKENTRVHWVQIVPEKIANHYEQYLQPEEGEFPSESGGIFKMTTPFHNAIRVNNLPVQLKQVGVLAAENPLAGSGATYTPKNNKLFTYPFCYSKISDGTGGSVIVRNEYFDSAADMVNMPFSYDASIYPEVECSLTPYNYLGGSSVAALSRRTTPYSVTRTEKQSATWWQDDINQYMSQQGTNAAIAGVGKVLSSAVAAIGTTLILGAIYPAAGVAGGAAVAGGEGAAATGGGLLSSLGSIGATSAGKIGAIQFASGAITGLTDVASNYAQGLNTAATSRPNLESMGQSGGFSHAIDPFTFSYFAYTPNASTAERIDNYFTMFGYRENKIGNPEELYRPSYNYIQTTGLTVVGGAPATVLADIATIYNNGIRFWSPDVTLGDFSVDNSPTA